MIVFEREECVVCHDLYPVDMLNEGMCEHCEAMTSPHLWDRSWITVADPIDFACAIRHTIPVEN